MILGDLGVLLGRLPFDSVFFLAYNGISIHKTMCNMRVLSSLRSQKQRDRNCQVVRRGRRVYVINKKNRRFNARQG